MVCQPKRCAARLSIAPSQQPVTVLARRRYAQVSINWSGCLSESCDGWGVKVWTCQDCCVPRGHILLIICLNLRGPQLGCPVVRVFCLMIPTVNR